jgi:hypothetical protein
MHAGNAFHLFKYLDLLDGNLIPSSAALPLLYIEVLMDVPTTVPTCRRMINNGYEA